MAEHLVELRGVRKTFGEIVAVDDVTLSIEQGEFLVLLGPSGSGKTTLLSILGGFTQPTSGEVVIGGEDVTFVPPAKRSTVTVFQDYALFPHMSVRDNVGFGLAMRKVPRSDRNNRVENALRVVGLEGFGPRRVHQLSGGQRQRVALARALVVEPAVLLLDEPLGALDLKIRQQMQEELVHLQKRLGTTFVHVTHDQEEAMNIGDKIVVVNHGRIEDMGPPERVYLKPASLFAATFMGDSNILTGTATDIGGGKVKVETSLGEVAVEGHAEAAHTVHLSVRPEHIRVGNGEADGMAALGQARVTEVVFQGTSRRCHMQAGADEAVALTVRLPPEQAISAGEVVPIQVRASDLVMLRD
jgi:spermidine/putrescine transport system ATP-binding protein